MTYFADTYRTVVGPQRREAEESSPWHQKKIQWWEPYSYMAGYSADLLRNNINLQALFSSTKTVWTSTIIRFVWVFQLAAKDGVISRASNSQPTYAVCNFFLWQRLQQNLHELEIWPCAFPHQIAEEHRQSAWGDVDVSLQPKITAKNRDKKGDGDFSYRKGEVCGIADLNSDSALLDSEPQDAAAIWSAFPALLPRPLHPSGFLLLEATTWVWSPLQPRADSLLRVQMRAVKIADGCESRWRRERKSRERRWVE